MFVAAGRLAPALRAPLPPSRRRQAICVAQVVCLIAALAPPVPAWAGGLLAELGLGLLLYSFGIDVLGMVARRRR